MATGTEGPDVFFVSLTGFESIQGLGGDDVINVDYDPAHGSQAAPRGFAIDGGAGFDTLNLTTLYLRQLFPGGTWIDGSTVRHIGTLVDYTNIERIYVSSSAYFGNFTGELFSGSWSTGDTIDEIHVEGVAGGHSISVFTGGSDDEIYLGPVGDGSSGHGGTGNDLVDLSGFSGSSGSAFGDEGNDTLVGSAQADTLDGGSGVDTMTGGAGDDIYAVDDPADTVVETPGGGVDTVLVSAAVYTLAAGIEKLVASTGGPHDFTLTAGHDMATGNTGGDLFRLHYGGSDTAIGLGNHDIFYFGGALDPSDVIDGGAGTDTLVLQGDYRFGLLLTSNVTGIENISMLAGSNTSFGDPGTNRYDYLILVHDSNFAAGVQARINGSALLAGEDFTFNGSLETDASFLVYGGRGEDALLGGLGDDIFFFGDDGRFAAGDAVAGGAGHDSLFLRGTYTIDFTAAGYAGALLGLENLTLSSASDERYARGGGAEFDYNLILSDSNVGAGQELIVSGSLLMANETMILDASQETNGILRLFGGKAGDTLKGGGQADLIHGNSGPDILAGGGGADVFRYQAVTESYSVARDHITDFTPGTDKIDLTAIDASRSFGGDQAFTWIGSNAFSNTAGELRAFQSGAQWIVQGDINGDGFADLIIALTLQGPTPLGAGDFLL